MKPTTIIIPSVVILSAITVMSCSQPSGLFTISFPTTTATPTTSTYKRVENGEILVNSLKLNGGGDLTIHNNGLTDAVITLTAANASLTPLLSFFVYSLQDTTINGIDNGDYYCYFTTGHNWDGNQFKTDATYRKFAEPMVFSNTLGHIITMSSPTSTTDVDSLNKTQFPNLS